MPDYRRNRVPGATYFFTVNLYDRRSDLLMRHVDGLRGVVRGYFGSRPSISMLGSCCLTTCTASGPCRPATAIFPGVGAPSNRIFEIATKRRAAIRRYGPSGRTRDLAAPVLGAHDPRRSRLCRASGLHPLQPREARIGRAARGLALFELRTLRESRPSPRRLDWWRRRSSRCRRATRMSGGMRCAFPPYGV
jgi:hypothetical protein